MQERRQFTREQADWLAVIDANDTIFTSPVRNLSLGGAELIRPQQWKPEINDFCKVSFSDMNPAHTLEVQMQICWTTKFSIGLKFNDLDMTQKIQINKIISDISENSAFGENHSGK